MRSIIALFLVIGLLLPNISLSAESLESKKDNLDKQAQEQQQIIKDTSEKLDDVSSKMQVVYSEWQEATKDYENISQQLDETNDKLDVLEAELNENQENLNQHVKYLERRVRDIYIHGQISYLDVLFGAQDFNDFLNRVNIIKRILTYDYNLIKNIQEEQSKIKANKAEQEAVKADIEKLHAESAEKKAVLDDKKAALEAMEDKLRNDKATAEKAYAELQAASAEVQRMIEARASAGIVSSVVGSGQMIWPISGPITSPYGWRVHPIYGRSIFHSGLDIAGDYGDPIRAADDGTVTYAGWISGYGNTVMIDHGNGLVTLYGHNQELAVSDGQHVSKGQVISYCGSTGNSTGPHCHFEVRMNGSTTNPLNYL